MCQSQPHGDAAQLGAQFVSPTNPKVVSSIRMKLDQIVHSDPGILSGEPVFVGTRVPVRALLDYLEGGDSLEDFLENFPSVTREQAIGFLEEAGRALVGRIA